MNWVSYEGLMYAWDGNKIIVDPPSGWKYGFPAQLEENYEKQLLNAGYPIHEVPFAAQYSRYWSEPFDENDGVDDDK